MKIISGLIKGIGYLGSFSGDAFRIEMKNHISNVSLEQALHSDWVKIGNDFRISVKKVETDVKTCK